MKHIFTFLLFCTLISVYGQTITTASATYEVGDTLVFNFSGGNVAAKDWIGVYAKGEIPDGDPVSSTWAYISSPDGTFKLYGQNQGAALVAGEYAAHLFCCDGYQVLASTDFTITGDVPASISLTSFALKNKKINFKYSGGTGSPTDWIGIYADSIVPGTDPSLVFVYVPTQDGDMEIDVDSLPPGNYDAHLLCCDGYDVLASVDFVIYDSLASSLTVAAPPAHNRPITFKFTGGTGSLVDWIGIYPHGEVPDGDPGSISYLYVPGINGSLKFDTIPELLPGVAYDAHFFCCDGYDILASYSNFMVQPSATIDVKDSKLFTLGYLPQGIDVRFDEQTSGKLQVMNMMGQVVRSIKVQNETQVQFYNLQMGNYIVTINNGKNQLAQKCNVR